MVLPCLLWSNGITSLYQVSALELPLPDDSVHCVVTSPPYWMQRVYRGNDAEQGIGLEPTLDAYLDTLIRVFREVRRVLRRDGSCWVNLGDKRGGGGGHPDTFSAKQSSNKGTVSSPSMTHSLNKLMIPERFALAMQEDGWILRDAIIWHKPSPMPESVNGWRWERCRVKVAPCNERRKVPKDHPGFKQSMQFNTLYIPAQWTDCPGCAKCDPHGGYVLRKGNWRCTNAYEYIYQFIQAPGAYFDGEGVKVVDANRRNVWQDIKPDNLGGKLGHYATYPAGLPRICIQASTPEAGVCSECGAPWARVVEKPKVGTWHYHTDNLSQGSRQNGKGPSSTYETAQTLGWRRTCRHPDAPAIPATVLDPFCGVGTTMVAAQRLKRHSVGVDISGEYLRVAAKRLTAETMPMMVVGG